MTIIVEDGTGLADAVALSSVAEVTAYHAARGNTNWATLTNTEMEQSIVRATDYMGQVYRQRWNGIRVSGTQALDWPRAWVVRDDINYTNSAGYVLIDGYYYWPSDEVPKLVKNACAELALRAAAGELAPDIEQRVIRENIDVLEVQYDSSSPQYVRYRAIDNMLSPFLGQGSSGAFRKVVRT